MHDGGTGGGRRKGMKEESRERDVAKGNGTKREGWVETAAKSLDEEGWRQRGGR